MSDGAGKYERLMKAAIENVSQSFFDEYERYNAEFRDGAGLQMIVIREEVGDSCDWCADLAGVYDYEDAPSDVWQRHAHCRCMVITRTEKGTYQDAWSRKEFQSRREARIAREEEIIKDTENAIAPEIRERAVIFSQDGGHATIPNSLVGNFDDYLPLDISKEEKEVFFELRRLSEEDGFEHGKIILQNGSQIPCNSQNKGMVEMPISSLDEMGLKLYHSHTNDTPLSKSDLSKLLLDKVASVGNVTRNGDVFIASVGDGWIPSSKEYDRIVSRIAADVDSTIQEFPGFWEMTIEERNYIAIREQFYQITRFFGWSAKGGMLNG